MKICLSNFKQCGVHPLATLPNTRFMMHCHIQCKVY